MEAPVSHSCCLGCALHPVHQNDTGGSSVPLRAPAGQTPQLGHPLNPSHHAGVLEVVGVGSGMAVS